MRIPGKSEYAVIQWVKMWRGANTELGRAVAGVGWGYR